MKTHSITALSSKVAEGEISKTFNFNFQQFIYLVSNLLRLNSNIGKSWNAQEPKQKKSISFHFNGKLYSKMSRDFFIEKELVPRYSTRMLSSLLKRFH